MFGGSRNQKHLPQRGGMRKHETEQSRSNRSRKNMKKIPPM
jgi:hypothetical protein